VSNTFIWKFSSGFSVNKEVLIDNMREGIVVLQRVVVRSASKNVRNVAITAKIAVTYNI